MICVPRAKQSRNVARAHSLRSQMSLPEVLLWQALRSQGEVKFRRQHPVGPYVLDFYCAKSKLCVEIDGIGHDMGDRPARDVRRDSWLRDRGIEVIRIPATEVLADPQSVAEGMIRYRCWHRQSGFFLDLFERAVGRS